MLKALKDQIPEKKVPKIGRPKGKGKSFLDEFSIEIHKMLEEGIAKAVIARKFNASRPLFHSWLKQNPA